MEKKQMTQNVGVLMSDSHGNGNQFWAKLALINILHH